VAVARRRGAASAAAPGLGFFHRCFMWPAMTVFLFRRRTFFRSTPTDVAFAVVVFFVARVRWRWREGIHFLPALKLAHAPPDGTLLCSRVLREHSTHKFGASSPANISFRLRCFTLPVLVFSAKLNGGILRSSVCHALRVSGIHLPSAFSRMPGSLIFPRFTS